MTSADAPDNGASVMLRINQVRVLPRVLGIVLAGLLVAGEASAKVRHKKPAPELPVTEAIAAAVTPPPMRFFTINQVLDKRDGMLRGKPGVIELASADPAQGATSSVLSDVPAGLAPETSNEPFGLFTFRAPEGLLWSKWRGVESRMGLEASVIDDCRADNDRCAPAARKFVALARLAGAADMRTRVDIINRDVNQAIRYVSDFQQHGVADRWSSPLETLSAGVGDCEDYAIVKFALLQATGVAEADIKLMLVRDMAVRQDHAVLAVRIDGRWLVLDNRFSRPAETAELPHFMPLFAIDRSGVSLFAAPYAERPHHESESDVLPAAESDGFGGLHTLPLML